MTLLRLLPLSEFHNFRQKQRLNPRCWMFFSYLDRDSYHILYLIRDLLQIVPDSPSLISSPSFFTRDVFSSIQPLTASTLTLNKISDRPITSDLNEFWVVLFPISTQIGHNLFFKNQLQNLLNNSTFANSTSFDEQFAPLMTHAMKSIEQSESAWQSWLETRSPRFNTLYNHNSFLYGKLAAQYLRQIVKFPLFSMGEQVYNGIPLNFSVETFVDHYILPQLSLTET